MFTPKVREFISKTKGNSFIGPFTVDVVITSKNHETTIVSFQHHLELDTLVPELYAEMRKPRNEEETQLPLDKAKLLKIDQQKWVIGCATGMHDVELLRSAVDLSACPNVSIEPTTHHFQQELNLPDLIRMEKATQSGADRYSLNCVGGNPHGSSWSFAASNSHILFIHGDHMRFMGVRGEHLPTVLFPSHSIKIMGQIAKLEKGGTWTVQQINEIRYSATMVSRNIIVSVSWVESRRNWPVLRQVIHSEDVGECLSDSRPHFRMTTGMVDVFEAATKLSKSLKQECPVVRICTMTGDVHLLNHSDRILVGKVLVNPISGDAAPLCMSAPYMSMLLEHGSAWDVYVQTTIDPEFPGPVVFRNGLLYAIIMPVNPKV